jgi:hypothetical protein
LCTKASAAIADLFVLARGASRVKRDDGCVFSLNETNQMNNTNQMNQISPSRESLSLRLA